MAILGSPSLLTAADYGNLPETGPRYQLIEGCLYMAPAPNRYHQDISRNLTLILGNYLKQQPIGKIYHAPVDVRLDEFNVFQPDILFVAKERFSLLTEAGVSGAPDFIVEILSPKTAKLDLVNKKKQYALAGVRELWIIDPKKRTITIHRLEGGTFVVLATHAATAEAFESPTFPGLKMQAGEIFEE